jgi:hypothetical protein
MVGRRNRNTAIEFKAPHNSKYGKMRLIEVTESHEEQIAANLLSPKIFAGTALYSTISRRRSIIGWRFYVRKIWRPRLDSEMPAEDSQAGGGRFAGCTQGYGASQRISL